MKVVTGFKAEVRGAILALDFLLKADRREQHRKRMPDFSDSAIFHRLWDLFGVIRVPQSQAQLSEEEQHALRDFCSAFESLPWQPLVSHPHVSELEPDDLSQLIPAASQLSSLLKRRVKKPWWRVFSR
ncbi:MAG: hypothetical protein QM760_04280 [Nibricoccus sp.]